MASAFPSARPSLRSQKCPASAPGVQPVYAIGTQYKNNGMKSWRCSGRESTTNRNTFGRTAVSYDITRRKFARLSAILRRIVVLSRLDHDPLERRGRGYALFEQNCSYLAIVVVSDIVRAVPSAGLDGSSLPPVWFFISAVLLSSMMERTVLSIASRDSNGLNTGRKLLWARKRTCSRKTPLSPFSRPRSHPSEVRPRSSFSS